MWVMHEEFSGDKEPSLWKVLPGLEGLLSSLRSMAANIRYTSLKQAIEASIVVLVKYYNKTDASSASIVSVCTCLMTIDTMFYSLTSSRSTSWYEGCVLLDLLG
jgi:hypothetical protein